MTTHRAALFINPDSHTVKTKTSILAKIKPTPSLEISTYTLDRFDQLEGYIEEMIKSRIDTICIEGGDGTVQGVISACLNRAAEFKELPNFIILPGGMTNLVARHYGVKKPSVQKITALLTSLANTGSEQIISCHALSLLKIKTDQQIHFGFLFSTGAFANATKLCHEQVHTDGITGAKAVRTTLMRILFGRGDVRDRILTPSPFWAQSKDGSIDIDGEHILTLFSTLSTLMIGLTPFWQTKPAQSPPTKSAGLQTVNFSHIRAGARSYVLNIGRFLKSRQSATAIAKLKMDGFESYQSQSIAIYYHGPMVLDGEFIPPTDQEIIISASRPISFINAL